LYSEYDERKWQIPKAWFAYNGYPELKNWSRCGLPRTKYTAQSTNRDRKEGLKTEERTKTKPLQKRGLNLSQGKSGSEAV